MFHFLHSETIGDFSISLVVLLRNPIILGFFRDKPVDLDSPLDNSYLSEYPFTVIEDPSPGCLLFSKSEDYSNYFL
jgi:hypothetical protein